MVGRESFDSMQWHRTTLTLLAIAASVLSAPMEPWGSVPGSLRFDPSEAVVAQGSDESAGLSSALPASETVLKEHALAPEDKDEESYGGSALDESRISFLVAWCFPKAPGRRLSPVHTVASLYRLRC